MGLKQTSRKPGWLRGARRASGFSLVEMLVATLILAFGLIGLAALQATSLRSNTSAYHRSQVNFLAQDIIDRMRANRDAAVDVLAYDTGDIDTDGAFSTVPSADTLAANDIGAWRSNIAGILPGGQGGIDCSEPQPGEVICQVRIRWNDLRDPAAGRSFIDVSTQL